MSDTHKTTGSAEMAAMFEAQRQTHAMVHELLNILAVLKAEMDLAIDHAREALTAFYLKHPEL